MVYQPGLRKRVALEGHIQKYRRPVSIRGLDSTINTSTSESTTCEFVVRPQTIAGCFFFYMTSIGEISCPDIPKRAGKAKHHWWEMRGLDFDSISR